MCKSWVIPGLLLAALGCSNTTETGYKPRILGDSETVQRGYYASPFSVEAQQAEAERKIEFQERRPDVYR